MPDIVVAAYFKLASVPYTTVVVVAAYKLAFLPTPLERHGEETFLFKTTTVSSKTVLSHLSPSCLPFSDYGPGTLTIDRGRNVFTSSPFLFDDGPIISKWLTFTSVFKQNLTQMTSPEGPGCETLHQSVTNSYGSKNLEQCGNHELVMWSITPSTPSVWMYTHEISHLNTKSNICSVLYSISVPKLLILLQSTACASGKRRPGGKISLCSFLFFLCLLSFSYLFRPPSPTEFKDNNIAYGLSSKILQMNARWSHLQKRAFLYI